MEPATAWMQNTRKEYRNMKGNVRTKKKWYHGEIGKDLPITVVTMTGWIAILIGLYIEILWVYR
jgi:hypothetical protein